MLFNFKITRIQLTKKTSKCPKSLLCPSYLHGIYIKAPHEKILSTNTSSKLAFFSLLYICVLDFSSLRNLSFPIYLYHYSVLPFTPKRHERIVCYTYFFDSHSFFPVNSTSGCFSRDINNFLIIQHSGYFEVFSPVLDIVDLSDTIFSGFSSNL